MVEIMDENGRYTSEGNHLSFELENFMRDKYKELRERGVRGSDAELLLIHAVNMGAMLGRI